MQGVKAGIWTEENNNEEMNGKTIQDFVPALQALSCNYNNAINANDNNFHCSDDTLHTL